MVGKLIKQAIDWSRRHWVVIVLLLLSLLLRGIPVLGNNFSFMFDNAKDSLIIMEMGTQLKPSLVGAVTSIPGLFNGPFYYYAALPLNWLLGFQPMAGLLLILLATALSVLLINKYVGWLAGLFYAVSIGLIGTQQSAWSPYMTVFITLPVVFILLEILKSKKGSLLQLAGLFLLISISFHFQTAYGLVLLLSTILVLFLLKQKLSVKKLAVIGGAFLLPFLPLVVFEVRHNFHQTKQVLAFIGNYGEQAQQIGNNAAGLGRLAEITRYSLETAGRSLSPIDLGRWFLGLGLLISIMVGYYLYFEREKASVFLPLLLVPSTLYLFLPAKSYYFVALLPVWVVAASLALTKLLNKKQLHGLAGVVLILAGVGLWQNWQSTRVVARQTATFYGPKLAAVEKVYELSNGQPFSSYHFVPEIYDYTYQFIYLNKIRQGAAQPIEFSYAPGESGYIQQKHLPPMNSADQLAKLDQDSQVFLIVEKPVYQNVQDEWWQRVTAKLEVESSYPINEAITVYQARPIIGEK